MSKERKLPELKADLSFRFSSFGVSMSWVSDDEKEMFVKRADGRWRWGGPFACNHQIASKIFEYDDNPTESEMLLMGGFVEEIGKVIDACEIGARELANEMAELRISRPAPKDYFGLDESDFESNAESISTDFVYLMRHQNGLTKIGKSRNPTLREKTLQAEDPRLEMIASGPGGRVQEQRLHKIFASVRRRGEWFDLEEHQVNWIKCYIELLNNKERR